MVSALLNRCDSIDMNIEKKAKSFLEEVNNHIKELKEKTHLVIMLVNADKKDKGRVKQEFADADYIFISRDTQKTHRTQAQTTGPNIYSPGKQGKYLAVIDLNIVHLDQIKTVS